MQLRRIFALLIARPVWPGFHNGRLLVRILGQQEVQNETDKRGHGEPIGYDQFDGVEQTRQTTVVATICENI